MIPYSLLMCIGWGPDGPALKSLLIANNVSRHIYCVLSGKAVCYEPALTDLRAAVLSFYFKRPILVQVFLCLYFCTRRKWTPVDDVIMLQWRGIMAAMGDKNTVASLFYNASSVFFVYLAFRAEYSLYQYECNTCTNIFWPLHRRLP